MKLEKLTRTIVGRRFMLVALLIAVLHLTFPHLGIAQAKEIGINQTFEIKIKAEKLKEFFDNLSITASAETETVIADAQNLVLQNRKELLYRYFTEIRPSRFANHVDTLAEQPEWRKVMAIAFVESTLGKRCY